MKPLKIIKFHDLPKTLRKLIESSAISIVILKPFSFFLFLEDLRSSTMRLSQFGENRWKVTYLPKLLSPNRLQSIKLVNVPFCLEYLLLKVN